MSASKLTAATRGVLVRVPGTATIVCRHGRATEVQVRLQGGEPVVESLPLCLVCGPVRYRWTRSRRRLRLLVGPEGASADADAGRSRRG